MQAHIGGTVSMSTVDWPRNVCTVVFFAGCDLNCPYCQNSQIIEYKEDYLKDIRLAKAEIKKNLDFIDAVLFSGGEPCLQRTAIAEIARSTKQLGRKVGVETNGTKPETIADLLRQNLLDFVALDIKAPLTNPELFEKTTRGKTFFKTTEEVIANVKETLKLLRENQDRLEIEIRTTIVPGLTYKKEDLEKIAEEIKDLDCRWVLQQFRPDVGHILDVMYKNINSPTRQFLENLKEHLLKKHPNLRIDVKAV